MYVQEMKNVESEDIGMVYKVKETRSGWIIHMVQ